MSKNPDAKYMVQEHLNHFTKEFSQEIHDYATNSALAYSKYLFVETRKDIQFGYCTHCGKGCCTGSIRTVSSGAWTPHLKLKHNSEAQCPNCGSWCIVKHAGRGRSNLYDSEYFVFYEKSLIDPEAIIARGIKVTRDYSLDYKKTKNEYEQLGLYVFRIGKPPVMLVNDYLMGWKKASKIYSLVSRFKGNGWYATRIGCSCNHDSIKKSIKGTPFQYWDYSNYKDDWDNSDYVEFFATFSRYPILESLHKLGFKNLVRQKLRGWSIKQVKWKAKKVSEAFKMPKQEFNDLRTVSSVVDADFLRLFDISRKDGSKLEALEIRNILSCDFREDALDEVHQYCNLKKIYNYTHKQLASNRKHFRSVEETLVQWRDYLRDCVSLKQDMKKDNILYPKDLKSAHEYTIKMVQDIKNVSLDKKIKARLKDLKKYCFKASGLLIRPAENANEIIEEGKALAHCVGRYAESHADGSTSILFVRKVSEPDKPYFTVEISKERHWMSSSSELRVQQCRGIKNCNPPKEVEEFMEAFKAEKLTKKKSENRVRIEVPA